MPFTNNNLATAILVLTLAVSGSMALAKGQDKSQTAIPGKNVQAEIVAAVHTLAPHSAGVRDAINDLSARARQHVTNAST